LYTLVELLLVLYVVLSDVSVTLLHVFASAVDILDELVFT